MTQRLFRIGRLISAELLKLRHHPFFLAALGITLVSTVIGGLFLREDHETVWRSYHAMVIFAGAAKVGLKLATFVMLIFGATLFAGEFDRGTIKVLLTRPITRTDLFVAKSVTAVLLALFFVGTVLYVSLALGCALGELGPAWNDEAYLSNTSYERLLQHAGKAVAISVAPVVAAVFLGMLISNCTESSGLAIAITLTLFFVMDEIVLRAFRDDAIRRYFFSHYPSYAFDVLRDFARDSSTAWKPVFESSPQATLSLPSYLLAPLGSMVACVLGGFAVFRSRNVTA